MKVTSHDDQASPRPPHPMLLDTLQHTKKAVIVTHILDVHFRNAAFDVVQRLTTKSPKPRRHADLTYNDHTPIEVQVHVLKVSPSKLSLEEEREMARFRESRIKIFVHYLKSDSSLRISLPIFDTLPADISLILDDVFPTKSFLDNHLSFVGYVFRPLSAHNDPFLRHFLEALVVKLSNSRYSAISARPLQIAVYLPPRPTSSDFDLDLPSDQVLSLQLLHLISDTLITQTPRPPSPIGESSKTSKFERRSLQLLSIPPTAPKPHRRSLSSLLLPQTSLKPLILRPAPGLVQSVSTRISLPLHSTSKPLDLSLKVTECLPPIEPATGEQIVLPTDVDNIALPPTPPPSPLPLVKSKLRLSIPTFRLPSSVPSPSTPISPLLDASLYTPIEKSRQLGNRAKPRSRQSSIGSTMTTKESEMDERWREVRRLLLLRRGKANDR
ncbi:hypothetical protein JCM5353_002835 [Sporobolomyces roseus]